MKYPVPFAVTLALLLGAYFAQPQAARLIEAAPNLAQWAPLALMSLGAAYALHFNRSRAFFVWLSWALAYAGLGGPPWLRPAGWSTADWSALVTLMTSFNLAAFTLMAERGVFTLWGLSRFLLPALEAALILSAHQGWGPDWPQYRHAGEALAPARAWTPLAPWGALTAGLAAMVLITLVFLRGRRQDPAVEIATAGSLAALLFIGHSHPDPASLLAFSAAAGAALLVALVQVSYSMAYIDQLTGLPGRRALEEQFPRLRRRFTVAMVDVDHFKKFNDTYGHHIGDQVLRMVATKLKATGHGAKVYRYGGEEFTIVFSGKRAASVESLLNEARERVAETGFRLRAADRPAPKQGKKQRGQGMDRQTLKVTVSMGVADRQKRQLKPPQVLESADEALYKAKRSGRNRVIRKE